MTRFIFSNPNKIKHVDIKNFLATKGCENIIIESNGNEIVSISFTKSSLSDTTKNEIETRYPNLTNYQEV